MNKKLPYEEALEQQLSNLPLPGQDASWQKMQALLDEKDRRRPFVSFNTNQGKGLLSLLLVLGFLVLMHVSRHDGSTTRPHGAQERQTASRKGLPAGFGANRGAPPDRLPSAEAVQPVAGAAKASPSLTLSNPLPPAALQPLSRKTPGRKNNKTNIDATKNIFTAGSYVILVPGRSHRQASLPARQQSGGRYLVQTGFLKTSVVTTTLQNHSGETDLTSAAAPADKMSLPLAGQHAMADGKSTTGPDALPGKQHRSFFVRAGVGVQQQIPLGGQKRVAFNVNGNKNLLSDYIPSLFLRLEKEQRWYMQAEFSYASPKLVKGFSYSRQTRIDSSFSVVTTSLLLKKVFYSELPVSFNYYLRPNWSAGVGATYSWFHGAITEKQTATRNLQTLASAVDKQIVPIEHYTDSFLYRSHTYLMLQTNYEAKNLSLGLRFSGDVQPYLKYTLPDGSVADKRNWSLELLVRLGLWRSTKF